MKQSPNNPDGKQTFLITSALPYANADIHLGHVVEMVQTDMFVRYQRLRGNRAVYVCADDTHGTPIELNALKQGISAQELIDRAWKNHIKDYSGFDIGFDIFYTTNSPENKRYAEFIFSKLQQNGLIFEKQVEQYYCEHDKRFLPDRFIIGICPKCGAADQYGDVCEVCGVTYEPKDLREPQCMLCKKRPVLKTSTHLFVELAKSEPFLKEYVNSGVLQEDMKNFVNTWITDGLRPWCISRDGPYFGFPIPGYPGKFFYVWLDAPIGYISSTDKWCADHHENIHDFWSEKADTRIVHCIGKDIVYFHTLFWPVMLKNAGFKLPSQYIVHGFLTVAGEKMSKTRGTFILARDFVEKVKHPLATQYLRFYYGAKLSNHAGDLDLNPDDFCNRVNTTLANNFGNLHHRTFVFADRYFGSTIPDAPWDAEIDKTVQAAAKVIATAYEKADTKTVVEKIHELGNLGNKYYQDAKPWELIKTDPQKAGEIIVTCANLVRAMAMFFKPIVPAISALVEKQLGKELVWGDHVFSLRNVKLGETVKLAVPIERDDLLPLFGAAATPSAVSQKEEGAGLVDIEQFQKMDLRIGAIKSAEPVEKSSKLLKLQVDIGTETRQVVAGIAQHYEPASLVEKQVVVIVNLKPATLMGQVSQGMLLAAKDGKKLVLIQPQTPAAPGSKVA